ncbi:MAG TPA: class I SAM-dependent methyltransferase [Vicinamibacterales bacterium]|nr:class I SAM-dependent methyltransferase [Vicinamibacterales bacterium]
MPAGRTYLPAAGRDIFLPLYDPVTRLLGMPAALRALVEQAALQPGQIVLDVGCGTGTLEVLLGRRHPAVAVVGLDPDPKALARARRKAARAAGTATFARGFADALPFGDHTFDRVFSSMMFHHLPSGVRTPTLVEIRRVLGPGGRLEFLDFAGGSHATLAGALHGGQVNAAVEDRLLRRMTEAGFAEARRIATFKRIVGVLAYYQAIAP